MRDIDVRRALLRQVLKDHEDDPHTRVVHELAVWGGLARADVAVINGSLHGFEIKSDKDNLDRLPGQVRVYSAVFDQVTLVCGARHIDDVQEIIPSWWGIKAALSGPRGGIRLHQIKFPKKNKNIDLHALAHFLWKEEAVAILEKFALDKGFRSKSKAAIYDRLAKFIPEHVLRFEVREQIKARSCWRSPE